MPAPLPALAEKVSPRTPPVDFTSPFDPSTLKGKSVIITGGASGIGLACATAFAHYGALVTILDFNEEAGQAISSDLTSKGYKAQFLPCDVTSYASQASAFQSAIAFGGGNLDIVFPNAGIAAQGNLFDMATKTEPSLDETPPEPGISVVDVNLKGVYYTCYLALHYFRLPVPSGAETGEPFQKAVVLLASMASYIGYTPSSTYSMAKFGVRGLFYGIRYKGLEQSPRVRINLVAPWFVKTSMTAGQDATHVYGYAEMEEVVGAVLRLAGDEGVTGRAKEKEEEAK
ncbi:hypothetical protein BCR34DRAFT_80586 [Clohesyomyces aquaticus]|uniref:NAD(P)-binding protein n=1 Tax=Clohesyomyces aquaticus TaxID=1231657 RepID=A0A1Y1YYA4_9PLEO|nr:hypothetical protein BCR34DRAFT_80586 [Clohesyomyces aquaticus]